LSTKRVVQQNQLVGAQAGRIGAHAFHSTRDILRALAVPALVLTGPARQVRVHLGPPTPRPTSAGTLSYDPPKAVDSPRASSVTTPKISVTFLTGEPTPVTTRLFYEEATVRPRAGGRSIGSGHTYEKIRW
jgi:hypothetical protein